MALGTIPPWLNVGPTDYLRAIQAGTQSGLEVARTRAAMQEAAARRMQAQQEAAQRAWEFGERMRIAAEENARQQEYQRGLLDFRNQQMQIDAQKAAMGDERARARLEEQMRHNLVSEQQAQAEAEQSNMPTLWERDPNKAYISKGGAYIPPEKSTLPTAITPAKRAGLELQMLNAEAPRTGEIGNEPSYMSRTNRVGEIRASLPPLTPYVPPPQMGTNALDPRVAAYEAQIAQEEGGKRVRVRSPEGKTGTVAAENLEEALAAGYTRL